MRPVFRLVPRGPLVPLGPEASAAGGEASDEALAEGLRGREPWAAEAMVDRFGDHVRRVIFRVLGGDDSEHDDLAQEVFARAWQGGARLERAAALKAWLTRIAVFVARELIRRRRRRRWLSFHAEPPEIPAPAADPELREAIRSVYRLLDRLPVDERVVYSLRVLEGMEIAELADACGMSVATTRRRLASAERRFRKLAGRDEALAPWMQGHAP